MTTPTLEPHLAGARALLAAHLPATVTVYDSEVPTTPGQTYVVLYPEPGTSDRSSLRSESDRFVTVVQITCVGTTPLQARAVLDKVRAALVDRVPTVTGRVCWPITEEPGVPPISKDDPARDPLIDRPRFYFTPRYRLASVPA